MNSDNKPLPINSVTASMKNYLTPLNIIFLLQIIGVILIAIGFVPRELALFITALLAYFVIRSPLEDSLLLIARSIPFFIALPITSTFDSFNTWRIIVLLVFGKWFFTRRKFKIKGILASLNRLWQNYRIEYLALILLLISIFSLIKAPDLAVGIKRVIYFINLGMLFVVVKSVVSRGDQKFLKRLMGSIVISCLLVVLIGYLQLTSTYFLSPGQFVNWWGGRVQLGFYGKSWSSIVQRGHTWIAYAGQGIERLRMFSTFPSSKSFPLFLLFSLPSLLTLLYDLTNEIASSPRPSPPFWWERTGLLAMTNKKTPHKDSHTVIARSQYFSRKVLGTTKQSQNSIIVMHLLLCLTLLSLILAGTRGIWMGVIPPLVIAFLLLLKRINPSKIVSSIGATLLIFIFLFPVASLIWSYPQFQTHSSQERSQANILYQRVSSITETEEASISHRLWIWRETLKSIGRNPFLGVGIGNFPVVLNQDIALAKAGSSAHNLYLNVAAEMGIFAFLIFVFILYWILRACWILFNRDEPTLKVFGLSSALFLLWVLGFSLTDATLFDERVFMMFLISAGMVLGLSGMKS